MADPARKVGAVALRDMLLDDAELALIDVREERIFSESHLLFARSVPLSRLELRMARSVCAPTFFAGAATLRSPAAASSGALRRSSGRSARD